MSDEIFKQSGMNGFCNCPLPWVKHCYGGKKGVYVCILKWIKDQRLLRTDWPNEDEYR